MSADLDRLVQPSPSSPSSPDITSMSSSPYPFATAPDIIRAHQKDAHFQATLTTHLTDLHRRFLGARSAHAWAPEARSLASLLYLSLTTLLGNRTLGEEYCDLVQIEGYTGALPSLIRRISYIFASILAPYGLSKVLPLIRAWIRKRLERNIARMSLSLTPKEKQQSWRYRLQNYILTHLSSITSPAPTHALTLACFYFTGSYYELSKRLASLRYIFTRKVGESPDRAGYEVLGVLLVVQMAVQSFTHLQFTLFASETSSSSDGDGEEPGQKTTSEFATAAALTHTPHDGPRYDLGESNAVMGWIKGAQQRKCTSCLEEFKDPAVAQCGHVFCWSCIEGWLQEKPECPLCRRDCLIQHVLPLRSVGG